MSNRKKAVLPLLILALLFSFAACTANPPKEAENIAFSYTQMKLVPLDTVENFYENEYFLFRSVEELQNGLAHIAENYAIDAKAEGESQSPLELSASYTADFFKEKALLYVKRYHSTDTPLKIEKIDVRNNSIELYTAIENGHERAEDARSYWIVLDKAPYLKNDMTLFIDVREIEAEGEQDFQKYLTFMFGTEKKVIKDTALAEKIKTQAEAFKGLTPSDYDPDDHVFSLGDLTFLGPDFYATFTADYIEIGGKIYAPNETIYHAVRSYYVSLDLVETEIPTEKEDNLDEKP